MFYTEAKGESIIESNQSKTNNWENVTGDALAENIEASHYLRHQR